MLAKGNRDPIFSSLTVAAGNQNNLDLQMIAFVEMLKLDITLAFCFTVAAQAILPEINEDKLNVYLY